MSREEQQLPTVNEAAYCQDTVQPRIIAALDESKAQGVAKYGTALQPFNRRDVITDMQEEVVDLLVYMEQNRRERKAMIEFIKLVNGHPKTPDYILNVAQDLLNGLGLLND